MKIRALYVTMAIGVISFLLPWGAAGAAGFPEKPVELLVGWGVGSVNDTLDRVIAKPLSKILNQPVIIQNVPGAAGALVLGRIKSGKLNDGYSVFQTMRSVYSLTPWTRTVPYDPLKDFAYVAQHATLTNYLLTGKESPWKNFEELIQYVKKNPKKVKYSTTGVGSEQHLMMEYLAMKEGLQWIHVPFLTGPEAYTAVLGGHVDIGSMALAAEREYIITGQLRPLLVYDAKRNPLLPDVPTILEKGYDFSANDSYVWTVPADTPKEIQKILEKAFLQAFADDEVKKVLNKANKTYDPVGSEALTKKVFTEHQQIGEIIKTVGRNAFNK
ncbi:MAG: tripartite tricarboxylate transporter substrate binding protein [Deltaproteobacteria bacterium]|nr:tripartite tricarboxylate transporter substrate binding protein [Deltaproteobacteria bacterium]